MKEEEHVTLICASTLDDSSYDHAPYLGSWFFLFFWGGGGGAPPPPPPFLRLWGPERGYHLSCIILYLTHEYSTRLCYRRKNVHPCYSLATDEFTKSRLAIRVSNLCRPHAKCLNDGTTALVSHTVQVQCCLCEYH